MFYLYTFILHAPFRPDYPKQIPTNNKYGRPAWVVGHFFAQQLSTCIFMFFVNMASVPGTTLFAYPRSTENV